MPASLKNIILFYKIWEPKHFLIIISAVFLSTACGINCIAYGSNSIIETYKKQKDPILSLLRPFLILVVLLIIFMLI